MLFRSELTGAMLASAALLALLALLAPPVVAQGGRRDTTARQRDTSSRGRDVMRPSADTVRPAPRGREAAIIFRDTSHSPEDSARLAREAARMADQPPVITHHAVRVGGAQLRYTATTGMMPIRNEATGVTEGSMFYVAYTLDGASHATRPITFVFNGGPGSSTIWLHMGAYGPRRVRLLPDGSAPPPPVTLEDNPYTLLDQTDLVFLDPVGTGYSRPVTQELGRKFWGLDEDIASVGEFIRLYLTRYERWSSPKLLSGESYGTTRAAGLSGYLVDRGIALNGIILISSVLDFQTLSQTKGNDIAYIGFLPSYTATAWYHKKLPAELQSLGIEQVVAQAERWAETDYALALSRGARLAAAERQATIDQMSRFTGLSKDFIDRSDLRVPLARFDQELLRDRRIMVGRLDSRFQAFDMDAAAERGPFDPSEASIRNTFTPVLNDYVRRELGFRNENIYYVLGGGVGQWHFPETNSFATVVPSLERAFNKNPYMKLYVAEGYYDMATPYFAVEYTLSHLILDPKLRGNITTGRFPAGHMMYIDEPSMQKLRAELTRFIAEAVKR